MDALGCASANFATDTRGARAATASCHLNSTGCIERFNRTYREEVPSAYLFDSLDEVREITAEWLERYNQIRPHDALGSLPPARYREQLIAAETPV
jgi:transposase InsO family protein